RRPETPHGRRRGGRARRRDGQPRREHHRRQAGRAARIAHVPALRRGRPGVAPALDIRRSRLPGRGARAQPLRQYRRSRVRGRDGRGRAAGLRAAGAYRGDRARSGERARRCSRGATGSRTRRGQGDRRQPLRPRRQGRGRGQPPARRCGLGRGERGVTRAVSAGRVAAAFDAARDEGRAAFVGYLTAGFPDPDGFLRAAAAVLEHADMLEVGLPFSDPLGDGPTVQRASERALARGGGAAETLELVASLRASTDKPLVVMSYYNPIYCYPGGEESFVSDLAAAGGDGMILPDLPPDEGEALISAARSAGLDTVFLVAPTSTDARVKLVAGASTGFVYAVSVTGVTGERESLPADVADLVSRTQDRKSVV